MRRMMLAFLLLSFSPSAVGAWMTFLRVDTLEAHPSLDAKAQAGPLFFTEEDARVVLTFGSSWSSESDVPTPERKFSLDRNWWNQIRWDLRDAKGDRIEISPRPLRVPTSAVQVSIGTPAKASFSLGTLAAGHYTLSVTRDSLTAKVPFVVVRGDENVVVRRSYVRWKTSDSSLSYPAKKEFLLELAQLEPKIAFAYEKLGDLAALAGHPADAISAYDEAIQIVRQRKADWSAQSESHTEGRSEFDKYIRKMSTLRTELPRLLAAQNNVKLHIEAPNGEKVYRFVNARTGRVVKVIE